MIHQIYSEPEVRDDGTRKNTRTLCEHAAQIIAVSNNTKMDLCRYIKIPEEKVSVVYHATNLCYRGEPRYHQRPYLLYVGVRAGYKNFLFFLSAISRLLDQANLDLICAGAESFNREERQALCALGIERRVRHVLIQSSQQLSSLYHFADAFCYPSLYEGFGIPLLEAYACECPVVISSAASFPEVADEAAEYFWPTDQQSIVSAVERTLNPARRAQLICLGKKRLKRFSWQQSAMRTLEVYRAAL
jgi:glycosyltransferase involved in cell wall biosynthesis